MNTRMRRSQAQFLQWLEGQGTPREVAKRLGVTDEAVRRWKRREGFPDVTTLFALRLKYGLDLNQLAAGDLG